MEKIFIILSALFAFGITRSVAFADKATPATATKATKAQKTVNAGKGDKAKGAIRSICVAPLNDPSAEGRCLPERGKCPYGFVQVNTAEPVGPNDRCTLVHSEAVEV